MQGLSFNKVEPAQHIYRERILYIQNTRIFKGVEPAGHAGLEL